TSRANLVPPIPALEGSIPQKRLLHQRGTQPRCHSWHEQPAQNLHTENDLWWGSGSVRLPRPPPTFRFENRWPLPSAACLRGQGHGPDVQFRQPLPQGLQRGFRVEEEPADADPHETPADSYEFPLPGGVFSRVFFVVVG